MAEFHFVEDYERHVQTLMELYPIDEAMSLAIGGGYETVGLIERDIVHYAGLRDGMSLVDLGCGSGRLAHALSKTMRIDYVGIDIVGSLLDYAKTKSAPNYRFILHQALSVPIGDASCDMISAFSVFTHLLHEETYIYLEDSFRALKSGGTFVFSFLEFADAGHWMIFQGSVDNRRSQSRLPLNTFIERQAIATWANHIGFRIESIVDGPAAPWGGAALGQSVVILKKE